MTRICTALITALVILLSAHGALASETGAQFQFAGLRLPEADAVTGFRLNLLFAKNTSVGGVDLGLATFTQDGSRDGFTFNMGISMVEGNSSGCACTFLNIHQGQDTGANIAFVNVLKELKSGANIGFVNMTEGHTPFDLGGLSMSKTAKTQIGFVNFTERIDSFQFGFLNFAENGFFPVFPFVNYPKKN